MIWSLGSSKCIKAPRVRARLPACLLHVVDALALSSGSRSRTLSESVVDNLQAFISFIFSLSCGTIKCVLLKLYSVYLVQFFFQSMTSRKNVLHVMMESCVPAEKQFTKSVLKSAGTHSLKHLPGDHPPRASDGQLLTVFPPPPPPCSSNRSCWR